MAPADWRARGEAYLEAARHLDLHWTDDKKEIDQGAVVAALLVRESNKCHKIADDADKLAIKHGYVPTR